MNAGPVVVVGSFVAGIVVRAERLPRPGETIVGDACDIGPGGKGANAAVAAARSGATVELIACVGSDAYGDLAADLLSREGIDSRGLIRTDDAPTGIGLVHLDAQRENAIAVYPGANLLLSPAHVARAAERIPRPRVVVCQNEVPEETVLSAIAWAKATGALMVLDPAPFRPLPISVLRDVDVLTPNEGEASEMAGYGDAGESALRLQRFTGGWVMVTTGASGCLLAGPDGQVEPIVAPRVDTVDTTGAGDVATGAIAAALASGEDVPASCRWGMTAAALSTTGLGTVNAVPIAAQIRGLLRPDLVSRSARASEVDAVNERR